MIKIQQVVAVIDDEPEMRKALRRLLVSRGFAVEEYERGDEFLALSRFPNCVLLDIQMPGLNGFEVLAALGRRPIHVPIIVITGHDEPGTATRVRALGASTYLKKPVDRDVLVSAIAEATASTERRKC